MELSDFRVGMEITILKEPINWSSKLNKNCPLENPNREKLNYPYHCVILEIICDVNGDYSMTDGNYGWSLSSLFYGGCLDFSSIIRQERLKKLNRLDLLETDEIEN